jgi:hypothetical protein
MWQQLVDPRSRMGLHANEHVGEVLDRVDVVRIAGGDQRVEPGQVLAGGVIADEEEVLPAEGADPERPLGLIVVERQGGVGEEEAERVPLVERNRPARNGLRPRPSQFVRAKEPRSVPASLAPT